VVTVSTPDTVIGLGGAGKEIVFHMLEGSDATDGWLVEQLVDSETGGGMDVFAVDTEQKNSRKAEFQRRASELNERIKWLADQRAEPVEQPTISYVDLVENTQVAGHQLLADAIVRGFAEPEQSRLQCWWYDESNLDRTTNYNDGVDRRRSLAKSLYYANRAGPDPLEEIVQSVAGGQSVKLVVGIGGGTGSGALLDLARDLNRVDGAELDLFAVLPAEDANENELANAHAALSELEYLALTGQNPFRNIVLLPAGPADDIDEFDEAIVHSMLLHEQIPRVGNANNLNMLDESMQGGPDDYAPFTVAVPHIFRYNASSINATRENFRQYRREKQNVWEQERQLYDEVTAFLERFYPAVYDEYERYRETNHDEFRLLEGELAAMGRRLEEIETLVSLDGYGGSADVDAMTQAGYEVAEDVREQLDDHRGTILVGQDSDRESAEQRRRLLVERLPDTFLNDDVEPPSGFNREEDQTFHRLVREFFEVFQERRAVLRGKNLLDDETASEALGRALNTDVNGADIRRSLKETAAEKNATIDDRENEAADLETAREVAQSRMAARLDDCRPQLADAVEQLIRLRENQSEIESLLTDLRQTVETAVDEMNTAGSEGITVRGLEFDEFGRLNDLLEAVGMEPLNRRAFDTSVERAKKACSVWLDERHAGVLEQLINVGSRDPPPSLQYEENRNEVDGRIVRLPPWDPDSSFEATVRLDPVVDRLSQLRGLDEQLLEQIVATTVRFADPDLTLGAVQTEVRESVSDPDNLTGLAPLTVDRSAIESAVEAELSDINGRRADEMLSELTAEPPQPGTLTELFHEAYLGPFDERIDELRDEIEQLEQEREELDRLQGLLETGNRLRSLREDAMEPTAVPEAEETDEDRGSHLTVQTTNDRGQLIGFDDIGEADLWEAERAYIGRELDEIATEVNRGGDGFLPLRTRRPTHTDAEPPEYDQFVVFPVVASRALEDVRGKAAGIPEFDEVIRDGTNGLRVPNAKYQPVTVGDAPPWDLSLTVFVGGVSLDNLAPARDYHAAYERERETTRESPFARNTHGLDGVDDGDRDLFGDDNGAFLYRESLLDLGGRDGETEDSYRLLDESEGAVVDWLLDHHHVETLSSTVSFDRDEE
jgi:hypothetical protein